MATRQMVYAGLFVALGVVLPLGFHLAGMGGSVFLPMHIPVLLAGFVLGRQSGALVGVITPAVSHLLCGMPPASPPLLPIMIVELAVYGWTAGFLCHRTKILPALLGAMIAGRLAAGGAAYLAGLWLGFNVPVWVFLTGAVIKGLPGIALQFVLIPSLVRISQKFIRGENNLGQQ